VTGASGRCLPAGRKGWLAKKTGGGQESVFKELFLKKRGNIFKTGYRV